MHKKLFLGLGIVSAGLMLLLASSTTAFASHFRGGNMFYSITSSGVVTVTAETLWRKGDEPFPFDGVGSIEILDASRNSLNSVSVDTGGTTIFTDQTNANFDFRRQSFTIDLANLDIGQGVYFFRYEDCCRIADIQNAPESTFSLEMKVIFDGTANSSPQLNASFITTIARGFAYSQNLNASDPDATPLSYKFLLGATGPDFGPSSQISGITLDSTGQVQVSATDTTTLAIGNWVFKVQVTDESDAYAQRDVMVNVIDTSNTPPVLNNIGNQTVAVGQTLTFSVSATDVDEDTITLSASTLPTGASFEPDLSHPASKIFSWAPVSGQEGDVTINFEAQDDGNPPLTDSEQITISVLGVNTAPVLAPIDNPSIPANATLSVAVSCADSADAGDNLTLTASFLPDGAAFTQDTFGNQVNGTLTWTPTVAQEDQVFTGIVLRCTDNGLPNLFDEKIISISVGAANQAPVLNPIGAKGTRPDRLLAFTVSAIDPDEDTVSLSIGTGGLPPGADFNSTTGLFTWTPTSAQAGLLFTVNFNATDNGLPSLTDAESVDIGVGKYPALTATDPNNEDTDSDSANDGDEVAAGSDPLDPLSVPTSP